MTNDMVDNYECVCEHCGESQQGVDQEPVNIRSEVCSSADISGRIIEAMEYMDGLHH